ncbi:MAG: PAS domain S-box protein [Candidatus Melainabacteria bacterium]|nr:PAS domain S-box protein [Candidatus Melainabacteria bacterium]
MFTRLNATQKGMVLVAVPVLFELLFIAAIYLPLNRFAQSLESMSAGNEILLALQENEIELSRVICAIAVSGGTMGDKEAAAVLNGLHRGFVGEKIWKNFDIRKNPELAHAVDLGKKMDLQFERIRRSGNASWERGLGAFHRWLGGSGARMFFSAIQDQKELTRTVLDIERHTAAQQPEELAGFKATVLAILWAGFVLSVFLTVGLVFLFTREMVVRLSAIEKKAEMLAIEKADSVSHIPDAGTDEVAELDVALVLASAKLAQARARQAVVLDNSADVICSLDSRLKFAAVGHASSKAWGFAPDELLGQSVLNIIADSAPGSTSAVFTTIREGSATGKLENIIVCRDGAMKDSIWSVSWSPERRQYHCVVHDVTELRAIEKLKQHFLSVASHDLRAPLTSVTLNISIITESLRDVLPPLAMTELARVQTSAQRLSSLVNELLELDKLEAGKFAVNRQRVGVSDACEAAKALLFGLARETSITLVGPENDAVVKAEEKRLVQMITNLLSNAIKFSPPGGKVSLSVLKKGGFAEIRVRDAGPGIAAEDCRLIFEKFSQADNPTSTKVKGTGLGLAVVKALAESHDGKVGVESEPGKGSTFWLQIPLADSRYVADSDDEKTALNSEEGA